MPLSIYQRKPGGAWYLRGTVAGVHIHESTRTSRKGEADAIRIRREGEILHRHAYGKAASLTFAEAALAYMGAGGEGRFLLPLLDHFGADALLSDIDNAAVNRAAAAIYPDAAPATINRQVVTPISAVYSMAAEEGLAPPRKFRRRKGDRIRTRWLAPEEAEALIAAAAPHILPALGFLLGAGCRAGEAISIDAANFHAATAEAWLPDTKNGRPRMVQLPARALDLILSRPLPQVGAILRTPKGRPYARRDNGGGQLSTAFRNACTAAGLGPDVTPHVLRHTWATWYYAQTRDFGGLLDLGGWQKADMAQRYRKIAPGDLADRLLAHGWDFRTIGPKAAAARAAGDAAPIRPALRVVR